MVPLARRDTLLLHDARYKRGSREEHVERVLTLTLGHLPEKPLLDELVDAVDDVLRAEHEDSAERHLRIRNFAQLHRRLRHEERIDAECESTEDVVPPHRPPDAPLLVEVVALRLLDALMRLVILLHHLGEAAPADADPLIELLREGENARRGLLLLGSAERRREDVGIDGDGIGGRGHLFLDHVQAFLNLIHVDFSVWVGNVLGSGRFAQI